MLIDVYSSQQLCFAIFCKIAAQYSCTKGWKGVLNLVLTNGKFRGNQQHG